MKKNLYTKNQAFDRAYSRIKNQSGIRLDGFDAPKKYHHNPDKLKIFKDFSHYLAWANELYENSSEMSNHLRRIYNNASSASSSFYKFNSEKRLFGVLRELDGIQSALNDLKDDIREFQSCMLATHISEKEAEIEILSDQLRHLSSLEQTIMDICNRKLFEISSVRMSSYSLLVSLAALFLALFSLLRNNLN